MSELARFKTQIEAVTTPEDLFGDLGADKLDTLKRLHKRFARICHEDFYAIAADKLVARDAFVKLSDLFQRALRKVERGTYGIASTEIVLQTKGNTYTLDELIGTGDISHVYRGHDKHGTAVIVKVADHPAVTEFMKNEVKALKLLVPDELLATNLGRYFPHVIDTMQADGRRITVFANDADFVPLTSVLAAYPQGLDPRHFVWIFKRLLTALDRAQGANVVHTAVLPSNVLIRPRDHALLLVGWSFAVERGTPVLVKSRDYKSWYPPEVDAKRSATTGTDLYMAAECMGYILGADPGAPLPNTVPPRFGRVLHGCLLGNPGYRSASAIDVYTAIDEAALRIYGAPAFVDLQLQGV